MYRIIFYLLAVFIYCCHTPSSIYAASIEPALIATFGNEGGTQCDKNDPGNQYPDGSWGCTSFGISPRSYSEFKGKKITIEDAKVIYKRDFWNPLNLDKVPSQIIAEAIFDAAVNQGEPTLACRVQEAINLANDLYQDIEVDCKIGPKTINLLASVDQIELYVNLIGLQYERYHKTVLANPKMKGWYKSWMYRTKKTVTKAVHDRDKWLASQK